MECYVRRSDHAGRRSSVMSDFEQVLIFPPLNSITGFVPIILVAGAIAVAGCGKKPEPPALPPPEPASKPIAESLPPPPALPTVAPPGNSNPALPQKTEAEAATIAMAQSRAMGISMIVEQFYEKNGRVPKDLNELVAAKMLLKVPAAPPGMRYVIDAQSRRVAVVPQ